MATLTPKTINELPSATSLNASDLVPISSGGYSKKAAASAFWATSAGGYCKMPDGTLIQAGSVTIPSGVYTATVSFDVSFVSDNFFVTLAPHENGTDFNVSTKVPSQVVSGHTILTSNVRMQ